MDVTYVKVKGLVGSTSVDLKFSVPLGDIIKSIPKVLECMAEHSQAIKKAVTKFTT